MTFDIWTLDPITHQLIATCIYTYKPYLKLIHQWGFWVIFFSIFLIYFIEFYNLWPLDPKTNQLIFTYIYTYEPSLKLIHQKVYEISWERSISYVFYWILLPLTLDLLNQNLINSLLPVYKLINQVWSWSVKGFLSNRENSLFLMYFNEFYDLWPLEPKTNQIIVTQTGTLEPSMKLIGWPVSKLSREQNQDGRTDGMTTWKHNASGTTFVGRRHKKTSRLYSEHFFIHFMVSLEYQDAANGNGNLLRKTESRCYPLWLSHICDPTVQLMETYNAFKLKGPNSQRMFHSTLV